MRRRGIVVILLAAHLWTAPAFADSPPAADQNAGQANDLFNLDLEALLDLKVTTASKFSEKLSDAPGIISVVTRDELQRFGGITLREVLERVPSLTGTVASFTDRSIVASRGDQVKINGGHILYLINGRPVREVLEGGLIGDVLESFPVSALERIEVIKGPGSVLYGSNAFSGVVNLITQKADVNRFEVNALGAGDSGVVTSATGLYSRRALRVVGAAQFHRKPEWSTNVHAQWTGLQNLTIPDQGRGGYLGVTYKNLSVMSTFTDWKTAYMELTPGQARWRRGFADIGYAARPAARWSTNVDVTYSRTTLEAARYVPNIDRDSHEWVAEWTNTVSVTPRNQLTFGALARQAKGREDFFWMDSRTRIVDGSQHSTAFYAQIDHQVVDSVKLIGGLQANKADGLDLDTVPRGGVIWNPANRVSVKALYSEAFRAPSLHETFMDFVSPAEWGGFVIFGSRDLLPEKVGTLDLALMYQGNSFQAQGGYFRSRHTDNIVLNTIWPSILYQNLGTATFQGVEGEGKYYVTRDLLVLGSALYQTNEDGDGNTHITPIANFGAKAGVSYSAGRTFTASVFDVYQQGQNGYANAINPKPASYHNVNANLRFDLTPWLAPQGRTGVAFVAHANNLRNREIWLPDWKDGPGDTTFASRGRSLYFGVDLTLGKR